MTDLDVMRRFIREHASETAAMEEATLRRRGYVREADGKIIVAALEAIEALKARLEALEAKDTTP